MIKTIYFATGNPRKVLSLKKALSDLPIDIIQYTGELLEPQKDNIKEVALSKARQAFSVLKDSVIVNDGGLVIPSLNGFPGPYTKYIDNTIGNRGIIKLLSNFPNREAYTTQAMVYIDKHGNEHIFEDQVYGTIAFEEDMTQNPRAWGNIWRIFIPKGANVPLASLPENIYKNLRITAQTSSVWSELHNILSKEI